MVKRFKLLVILIFGFMPLMLAVSPAVGYADTQSEIQSGIDQASGGNSVNTNPGDKLGGVVKTILNILSAIAGVAAVIMIMVAGIRFTASAGSEEAVKKAKSSIVYAVVGIVIVAVAQILVHFVISNVTTT